jgi:hypothetical protein
MITSSAATLLTAMFVMLMCGMLATALWLLLFKPSKRRRTLSIMIIATQVIIIFLWTFGAGFTTTEFIPGP